MPRPVPRMTSSSREARLVGGRLAGLPALARDRPGHARPVRITDLIKASMRTSYAGIGMIEPPRGDLEGWWSRWITRDHRLVYGVTGVGDDQILEIAPGRWPVDS
ncbi:type II toxin-antitoxin system YoeB family toxin [Methylobacterium sp. J-088]|uniref:type II toxin-antitoxin system YoeB family toxin n=1 Tax=Methylobacterium sp. J-088 TaxID=2836664 RepID=UPI00391CD04E